MCSCVGPDFKGDLPSPLLHSSRSKVGAALRKKTRLSHRGIRAPALCLPISLLPLVPIPGTQGQAVTSLRVARSW